QCRRTEVPHGDVVPHVTQSGSTCDIIARCSLLLAKQRNQHSKAIASQPFKIGVGRISAAQQTGFVNPPCIQAVSAFPVSESNTLQLAHTNTRSFRNRPSTCGEPLFRLESRS